MNHSLLPAFRFSFSLALATLWLLGCSATEREEVQEEQSTRPAAEYFLTSENTHNRWSRTIPPVLRVPSGAVIEVQTKEASDQQITPTSTIEDLLNMDSSLVHPLTGPVYVEGAEPGDTLAVTLIELEVLGWGWTATRPGGGFLPDIAGEPWLKTFQIDKESGLAHFSDTISIPVKPFPGVMGVAPDTDEMLRTRPPRENGGNMDNKYMTEGTIVYFPVLVEGALFSIGDTHAPPRETVKYPVSPSRHPCASSIKWRSSREDGRFLNPSTRPMNIMRSRDLHPPLTRLPARPPNSWWTTWLPNTI